MHVKIMNGFTKSKKECCCCNGLSYDCQGCGGWSLAKSELTEHVKRKIDVLDVQHRSLDSTEKVPFSIWEGTVIRRRWLLLLLFPLKIHTGHDVCSVVGA